MSSFDKRMQKAETAEITDEKGWAGWIRIFWKRLLREKLNCFDHFTFSISALVVTIVGPSLKKLQYFLSIFLITL